MKLRLSLLFVIIAVAFPLSASEGTRALPEDNLSYPVLITLADGSLGSGFFLHTEGGIYLVTAGHVLFHEALLASSRASLLSYPRSPTESGKNLIDVDLTCAQSEGLIKKHAKVDVAVVRVGSVELSGESERVSLCKCCKVRTKTASGLLSVGSDRTKTFGEVLVANDVYVFGYPTSLGIKELPQLDPYRPLLRKGIVAGLNPERGTIVLDCPLYPGNSGGPVDQVEPQIGGSKLYVIGVVSQFVPFAETWVNKVHHYRNVTISNSGYGIAIPMDFIFELTN